MALDDELTDDELEHLSEDERVVIEAKERFRRAYDFEADFRTLYVQDIKFANGDSDNGWQWPDDLKREREANKRPALTINKTQNHVALIVNDGKQNKPSVSVKPVGDEADYKAAQIFEGIVRHIEYVSGAQTIYDKASESQVAGGIGYWRVQNRYINDRSFDQELIIGPVRDPMNVLLDCDIKEKDGSDALWGFIFDDVPQKEFNKQYPKWANKIRDAQATGLGDSDDWIQTSYVRVAEYYRILETRDELIYMEDEQGNGATFYRSDVPAKFIKIVKKSEDEGLPVKRREVMKRQLQWFKIAGSHVIDKNLELKGKYIPIVRLVGKETVIEGRLERKGHVRTLKDPQRLYNYNSSAEVEYVALATKTPWVVATDAVAGNEVAWNNANRSNAAYLTYKHIDENGNPLPPPVRPDAPGIAPGFIQGMQIAAAELEMASGQYPSQFGKPSNETSGKAIAERQRQADTITYEYTDNLAISIRYTGKIILDLIPYYYDTERVIQILGKDGTQQEVLLKPDAKAAYEEQKVQEREEVQVIFNPTVGQYAVESDVGPAYSTQRQEAWNAFVQIVTGNPALIDEIGDLMFQSADFPLADKIAERLKRKMKVEKPYLFDDNAPTPQTQQLMLQLQGAQKDNADLLQKLAETKLKLTGKEQMRDIDAFRAETDRIGTLANAQPELSRLNPELISDLQIIIKQTLAQMLGLDITQEVNAADEAPFPQNPEVPQINGVAPQL